MSDLEKAARMALEALEYYQIAGLATTRVVDSITALRQAISDSVEQPAQQSAERVEPVAWRDHVEQRLLTWRQSFVNKSGDQLALDDFMDKRSLDDLIDFVCDEYTRPQAPVDWEAVAADQAMTIAMMKVQLEGLPGAEQLPWNKRPWQQIECPVCGELARAEPPRKPWVGLPESAFAGMSLQQVIAMKYADLLLKEKNT